ncbi:AzlC family ABC transporter permease [Streptococcus sciuri]|uniref:AzlC family ABC transporter permease n=1 Tax=Streptococcus sciuri TaxID=2973939 RepID=A0ABT2F9H7_9STRE|nr:AzlC family ABC transporter permease [Streptococcus sciuri]MCS4488472.1 AzlC family ABC transporter permease [Streptococcus sciuri]
MEALTFRQGSKASLPTALGYVSIGTACGVVGASSGISPVEMGLMSALVYGGSSQFIMCALLVAHAPVLSIVLTVFLVNLRHFLMSLHVTTIFEKASLLEGVFIGSLLTDESYGVLLNTYAHQKEITPRWMYGNNVTGYITWILSVFTGTVVGQYIPNPSQFGLDFALVAMFAAIFAAQFEAMAISVSIKKIILVLGTITLSYFVLAIVLSESLTVLLATLVGCFVGVCHHERV